MKRIISILCTVAMLIQLAAVPVFADDTADTGSGDTYTAPESVHQKFNMNLDWKFYDTGTDKEIWTAMATADKDGKKFYEKDYDDSDWETVSIPHAVNAGDSFAGVTSDSGGGSGARKVLLYRKTFTVPESAKGGKVIFELEGIRQAAYVWVNGEKVGYYEASITAFGLDLTNFVTPGEEAVIAICEDGTTSRGTSGRIPYETVPGAEWGSSYTPDNYGTYMPNDGSIVGAQFQWNTKDFNEAQIGLVYDSYLYVTGSVYQTFPLYNNLKTTGNYIYGTDFNTNAGSESVRINVKAEVRNESGTDGEYTLDVDVVDYEGKLAYSFSSDKTTVAAASDAGAQYQTAVEDDAYTREYLTYADDPDIYSGTSRPTNNSENDMFEYSESWGEWKEITDQAKTGKLENGDTVKFAVCKNGVYTETTDADEATHYSELFIMRMTYPHTTVNTPDVTYIEASAVADDIRFWSLDDPYLYTVYTILKDADGNVVDVQDTTTGFREVTYDKDNGISINGEPVWLRGYAQRSTNEWAAIGVATDWLQDYDMKLLKGNNANFIRWMHVAPKPAEVRSSDRYGIAVVCPAGDKESSPDGRQWSQRTEAMRDAMIYFRNSPSVLFWESGNNKLSSADKANEMAALRDTIDPYGMRFIGARSTTAADELNYSYNYAGTMYGNYGTTALSAMASNGIYGPIMETEYARGESPRRVWDDFSPPDYDYINKFLQNGSSKKEDGYDCWDATQEDMTISNVKEYSDGYYTQRTGGGTGVFSASAMMVWSDSNMHGRQAATENCRTSGRVDAVRQTKEMYDGMTVAQDDDASVTIIGHWSYPEVSDDTYNYFASDFSGTTGSKAQPYKVYDTSTVLKRDPTTKTVYVVGSAKVKSVDLYRLDGETETLIGSDDTPDSVFVYQFDDIDVTQGDAVIAKAKDANGSVIATDEIERTYEAAALKLEVNSAPNGWRADGSDITYVDVKVIDKNGNVCALNYDKISFEYEGEGTFMGGYNSGIGSGCFQNTASTTGLSNYFGGAKDGVSTIGQDYVYAENGTNRVFVKSTRTAGDFKLTAKMDGLMDVSVTITSTAVESEGGLTTQMQDTMAPGVSANRPETSSVAPMKPLAAVKTIDWSSIKVVTDTDSTVYYTININGEELALTGDSRAVAGTPEGVFGPIVPILEKLKTAGLVSDYTYSDGKLTFTTSVDTYEINEGANEIIPLSDPSNKNEILQNPEIRDGQLFVSLIAVLGYVPGVETTNDTTNHVLDVTFAQ